MKALKKYALPAVVSLTAAISTQVYAQHDSITVGDRAMLGKKMPVQASTVHSYKAQPHPLARNIIVKYKSENKSFSAKDAQTKVSELSQKVGAPLKFKRLMSGDAEVITLVDTEKTTQADFEAVV